MASRLIYEEKNYLKKESAIMIIYKNVDYGIYAYQIGFFKVKRIGEIVWSDQYDSKNEKFYL